MPDKVYGVALIGCGTMGEAHLQDIYYKASVRVEYVCDMNTDRACLFARKYGAHHAVTDYRTVLQDSAVDIVIIATYPHTHLEILSAALEAGKHVICEKPLASTLADGEKMVRLIQSHPECKVLIGYILRHNKTYQKVAEMIRSGAIGHPIIMRMAQNHHTMDWQKYLNLISSTSPMIDCGVHYIDVMHWFTGGHITELSGIGLKTEADVPEGNYNYGLLTAKLSDGSVAYYEVGWSNTMASDNLKEFVGPKGRISITYAENRTSHKEEGDLIEYYRYPEKTYEIINLQSKRKPTGAQLEELIRMIETGVPGSPSIDEVWESFVQAFRADECIRKSL